jgi:hypothetical protein
LQTAQSFLPNGNGTALERSSACLSDIARGECVSEVLQAAVDADFYFSTSICRMQLRLSNSLMCC